MVTFAENPLLSSDSKELIRRLYHQQVLLTRALLSIENIDNYSPEDQDVILTIKGIAAFLQEGSLSSIDRFTHSLVFTAYKRGENNFITKENYPKIRAEWMYHQYFLACQLFLAGRYPDRFTNIQGKFIEFLKFLSRIIAA